MLQKTKSAYTFWYQIYENSPKPFRTGLGFRIENLFIDLLESEHLATYARGEKKVAIVEQAQTKIDILRFLFQTAWETKRIKDKQYIAVSKILEEAGRMIFGWKKMLAEQQAIPRTSQQKLPITTSK